MPWRRAVTYATRRGWSESRRAAAASRSPVPRTAREHQERQVLEVVHGWLRRVRPYSAGTCQAARSSVEEDPDRQRRPDAATSGAYGSPPGRTEVDRAEPAPEAERQSSPHRDPRCGEHEQWRGDHHQQHVLHHVHPEQPVGLVVDRTSRGRARASRAPARTRARATGASRRRSAETILMWRCLPRAYSSPHREGERNGGARGEGIRTRARRRALEGRAPLAWRETGS